MPGRPHYKLCLEYRPDRDVWSVTIWTRPFDADARADWRCILAIEEYGLDGHGDDLARLRQVLRSLGTH
jgi:hypothetical protein